MATTISMEPSTSNPNTNSTPTTLSHPSLWPNPQPITSIPSPFKAFHRRRALSDIPFRIPADVSDPFNAPERDIGSDEDIFSKYIDVEKLCESGVTDGEAEKEKNDDGENGSEGGKWGRDDKSRGNNVNRKGGGDIVKSKKAMPANQLAELWVVDPKRAKRYIYIYIY